MKGDLDRAITYFEKARQLQPSYSGVYAELAYANELAGRMDQATINYRKYLEFDSDNPAILNNLAYRLAEDGKNLDESLSLAQKASQRVPGSPDILDTVGYIYLRKGMNDSALKTFQNLVAKHPNNATFLHHLAMTELAIGDKQKARQSAEKALASNPTKTEEAKIRDFINKIG